MHTLADSVAPAVVRIVAIDRFGAASRRAASRSAASIAANVPSLSSAAAMHRAAWRATRALHTAQLNVEAQS